MKLEDLQRAFFARIAQVGGADPALEREVRSHGALSASARLDLYANMYFARLLEVLGEDFPCCAKLAGESFEPLVAAYVRAQPSTHFSIAELGRRFPEFLRTQALPRPDLPALAALEWARAEAVTLLDGEPVGQDALAALGPEAFGSARLVLTPALRVLSFDHAVLPLWRALDSGGEVPAPVPEPSHAVVWRQGFEVFHASISAEEAAALRKVGEGLPLGEVCEAFAALEDPATAAFDAIGSWFAEGMVIAAVDPEG